jgi:hypothetical protein
MAIAATRGQVSAGRRETIVIEQPLAEANDSRSFLLLLGFADRGPSEIACEA